MHNPCGGKLALDQQRGRQVPGGPTRPTPCGCLEDEKQKPADREADHQQKGEHMKSAEQILHNIDTSYHRTIERAEGPAKQHGLNDNELESISNDLAKCQLLAMILADSAPEQWADLPTECSTQAEGIRMQARANTGNG